MQFSLVIQMSHARTFPFAVELADGTGRATLLRHLL